ncbi:hypothetical protein [Streptomyces sp. H27-H5]|uniref:hypothetical protein n=1 Tax=Streptomyces sp. H27-H5 TaxID=2996460 RepID=UPI00226F2F22|nr:hypothetical protein [Streptomyces sp. H27-H5]MCY0963041.1 hypothetical protein [Streptomyces sp. H27-H5]
MTACRAAAVERLREVLDGAFGAAKPGVTLAGLTVRATPGAALVDTARRSDDLLVVGILWTHPAVPPQVLGCRRSYFSAVPGFPLPDS